MFSNKSIKKINETKEVNHKCPRPYMTSSNHGNAHNLRCVFISQTLHCSMIGALIVRLQRRFDVGGGGGCGGKEREKGNQTPLSSDVNPITPEVFDIQRPGVDGFYLDLRFVFYETSFSEFMSINHHLQLC